jgi:hypothetical protein
VSETPSATPGSVELVTCSFAPDAKLCELLAESVDRHVAPSIGHTVIVPRRDLSVFSHLEAGRRRVLTYDDVVSRRVRSIPGVERGWLLGARPVRGWLLQQLLKLAAHRATGSDVLAFVDSDCVVLRPLDHELLAGAGRVRLFTNPDLPAKMPHILWHRSAARLLGLPERDWFGADYISHLTTWRRETVAELLTRVERVGGRDWRSAIVCASDVSEYVLYGVFVQHVLDGGGSATHQTSTVDLAHSLWQYDVATAEGRRRFTEGLRPHHVVVGIQSRMPLTFEQRLALLAELDA